MLLIYEKKARDPGSIHGAGENFSLELRAQELPDGYSENYISMLHIVWKRFCGKKVSVIFLHSEVNNFMYVIVQAKSIVQARQARPSGTVSAGRENLSQLDTRGCAEVKVTSHKQGNSALH